MKKQYEVVDCAFNQANYPDLIGKVLDTPPSYAKVRVITEKTPMREIFRLQSKLFEDENASDMIEDFVMKCLGEGYGKEEIIEGIGELFRQAREPATDIFNRTVVKLKGFKVPATSSNWYKKAQTLKKVQTDIVDKIRYLIEEEIKNGNTDYYIALEPGAGETYASDAPTMYFYGTCPEDSVNCGMQMRVFVDSFGSHEEAQLFIDDIKSELDIDVEISESSQFVKQELPRTPPSWFNPADAGEVWGEEDY